jgi:hypothetical protein
MKLSVIDMVQDILNDIDSDSVNSIDDTIEATQVAQILKSTFQAMMSNRDWSHMHKLIQLTSSGSLALPTHLYLPDNVKELTMLNYDIKNKDATKREFQEMKYISPDAFLRMSNSLDSSAANVQEVVDPTGVSLLVVTDKNPMYYTSFDDKAVVFDSYKKAEYNTLIAANVQAMAYTTPTWKMVDSFIPDLPEEAFAALLEEAKSRAFIKLKQMTDSTADAEAARQKRYLARKSWRVAGGLSYPDYGRKR